MAKRIFDYSKIRFALFFRGQYICNIEQIASGTGFSNAATQFQSGAGGEIGDQFAVADAAGNHDRPGKFAPAQGSHPLNILPDTVGQTDIYRPQCISAGNWNGAGNEFLPDH